MNAKRQLDSAYIATRIFRLSARKILPTSTMLNYTLDL